MHAPWLRLLHHLLLQVLWSSVVGFAEVKPELSDTSRYEEAVGQLMDRVQQLFQQQPERSHVLGAVIGRDALEVFHFQQSPNQTTSSGKLDLSATDGATMLLRMFYSSPERHYGFTPTALPSPLLVGGEPVADFKLLRPQRSPRGAAVYSCSLRGQTVVVKYGMDIEQEVCVAELPLGWAANRMACGHGVLVWVSANVACQKYSPSLAGWLAGLAGRMCAAQVAVLRQLEELELPHVPRVLAVVTQPGQQPCMVITPLGRHLSAADPPDLIAQVRCRAAPDCAVLCFGL